MTKTQDFERALGRLTEAALEVKEAIQSVQSPNFRAEFPTIGEFLTFFYRLKSTYSLLDEARKEVYHVQDMWDKAVVPEALKAEGLESGARVVFGPDLGYMFRVQQRYSASTKDKEGLFSWLRDRGDGDLITETVNAGTLATYLKNLAVDEGIDAPEDIVVLNAYDTTGVTKFTPK